jgi:hypothetical protein
LRCPKLLDHYTTITTITTGQQARDMVFEYIENYYNHNRLHSTPNYMTPLQFEENYAKMQNP